MTPEEKEFVESMRAVKRSFLRSRGGDGATLHEFQQFVAKDHGDHPEHYRLVPLLFSAARQAWGPEAPWDRDDDEDLFSIAGVKIPGAITVREHTPKGDYYRKVDSEAATLHQAREHAILIMEKGAQTSARGAELFRAVNSKIREAGGDMTRLVCEFRDLPKPQRGSRSGSEHRPSV
jgi:hypothetical protein